MPVQRTKEILEHARQFHQGLAAFYQRLTDVASRERVKLLLDYMSRHEERLSKTVEELENVLPKEALAQWVDRGFETSLQVSGTLELGEEMSLENVVHMAIEFDDCIISFYERASAATTHQPLKDFFEELIQMERRSLKDLVKNALLFQDL
jgi:rubrerythrin